MKSLLFVMIAGLASAAMLVSCGGDGSKASASGPFGEIPSLVSDFETFRMRNGLNCKVEVRII